MFSHRTYIVEFIVRTEIKDWFEKLFKETCGPDVQIRYLPNDPHFHVHTYVEISGNKRQIIQATGFIKNIFEILLFKMPWLNEHTYYVENTKEQRLVKNQLKTIKDTNSDIKYQCTAYNVIGASLTLFSFRPDLDASKKLEIEEIFKSINCRNIEFITYPTTRAPQNQYSIHMATNILTAFHGKFLNFLSLEDILSLEIANIRHNNSCYDRNLDHDIQIFLRKRFPELYNGTKVRLFNLKTFRITDVLCYFIHKYHDCLENIEISNILMANEIQIMSRTYNITIKYDKIVHIDFRPMNEIESVDFCAIYYYKDSESRSNCLKYNPKYATENYSMNFHSDGSLDPLKMQCNMEFSHFILKSQINSSQQKTNSVLKFVTDQFKACEKFRTLILYEFDLNQVSSEILNSLIAMMCRGRITFDKMNFKLTTLLAILQLSEQNKFLFRKCQIVMEDVESISYHDFKIRKISFNDMYIELNVLCILKNIKDLKINNCHILSTSWEVAANMEMSNEIWFTHATFDISSLIRILNRLQYVRKLMFVSCHLTSCELLDRSSFTVRNEIYFHNMVFKLQTIFKIFENCEIQKTIIFNNCYFDNDATYKCTLKPVKVNFCNIKFDLPVLFTILETLNHESYVRIIDSCILPLSENSNTSNKIIHLKSVQFCNSRLETNTLCNILGKMSSKTKVRVDRCDLLHTSVVYSNTLARKPKILFAYMKVNLQTLFDIVAIISNVDFLKCKLTDNDEEHPKINVQKKTVINFHNMTIRSEIMRSLLQIDGMIVFNKCPLQIMADDFSVASVNPNVTFRNMTFDLSEHLKSFANFTSSTKVIKFLHCHFDFGRFVIRNIVIKPFWIVFEKTTFDLIVLVTIMDRISDQTNLEINACDIRSQATQEFPRRPIQIPIINFEYMILEIKTILCILENSTTSLSHLRFNACQFLCTDPNALVNIKLKPITIIFQNMFVDFQIVQTFLQKGITIRFDNCKIIPARNNILSSQSVGRGRLVFENVNYSPEFVQVVCNLHEQYMVDYYGQLSIEAIAEVCTKTPVYGQRFGLMTQICTKSIHFELIAEFFRSKALDFDLDTNTEFDPPANFIPYIHSISCDNQYDWNTIKIKFTSVNDATVKVEFLKNSKPIDLFYELNDLPDDSEECVVDYY